MKLSAVILAGGKSSRMGRDKAFLEIGGRTLLARQIQTVREAGAGEVFISGRAGVNYSEPGCRVLTDQFSRIGPLVGIHAALAVATASRLLVLAVDLVEMDAAFLRELTQAGICVIPRVAGEIEPLAAVYPCKATCIAELMLREGKFAVRDFAEACVQAGLAQFADFPVTFSSRFHNLNSPADLPCLT
jgi:molybdopterin-guanine dinucleotide biosynthesis protein A